MTPTFEDFLDYYYNFGAIKDSNKDVCLFIGILCTTIIYELYKYPQITLVRYRGPHHRQWTRSADVGCHVCAPKVAFVYIQTLLFQSTHLSLFDLPIYILVAKMIPVNVKSVCLRFCLVSAPSLSLSIAG